MPTLNAKDYGFRFSTTRKQFKGSSHYWSCLLNILTCVIWSLCILLSSYILFCLKYHSEANRCLRFFEKVPKNQCSVYLLPIFVTGCSNFFFPGIVLLLDPRPRNPSWHYFETNGQLSFYFTLLIQIWQKCICWNINFIEMCMSYYGVHII
jgi:hypothetical protein